MCSNFGQLGPLSYVERNNLSILLDFLKIKSLGYLWSWRSFAEAEASVVPNEDVNANVDVIVKPVTLVLKEFGKSCIGIAKDHCREINSLSHQPVFIIQVFISWLCLHTRYPEPVDASLILGSKENLRSLKPQFHFDPHLLYCSKSFEPHKLVHIFFE